MDAQKIHNFGKQCGVLAGQIGKPLQGAGLDDRTGIIKVRVQNFGGAATL
jgi:hypothetical protein